MSDLSSSLQVQDDNKVFSDEHLREQLRAAESRLGYKILHFYVDDQGVISKTVTGRSEVFYLSPSGGTLRDNHFNIVQYSARYDIYKGIGKL